MKNLACLCIMSAMALSSCSLFKKGQIKKQLAFSQDLYQNHIGFVLYDPVTKEQLYGHNGKQYFTPASNVKILTFYAGLMLLGDRIPALEYAEQGDSLIFWGTGDPTFLNSSVTADSGVYHFLSNAKGTLYFSADNYTDTHFGPGWAWDDYYYSFSAEKSPFPIYGNTVSVKKEQGSKMLAIDIPYFKRYFYLNDTVAHPSPIIRKLGNNNIAYTPGHSSASFSKRWPFKYADLLVSNLLADTLHRKVQLVNNPKPRVTKTIYGVATDTLYQQMMQDSDNFIAEQLMLVYSSTLGENLNTQVVIDHVNDQYLYDLPDEVVWRDGSGLSRYNLVTPRAIVRLWEKIYHEVPRERLFQLLAAGGKTGTLKNYYQADTPYIYGKTGTLSNNHNLSGFLLTKSGKTLIFSYMNNNHIAKASEVKKGMEQLLLSIREKY
jgi:D-alanyl-D-alanine carboxypeptidase/D-alanyl-D-alanine-endopeptidase (penicillin-binding protein 4)